MINILFVSCYSTDINNSASIELIYYMNLLSRSKKFNVHLLTFDFPKNSIYYDGTFNTLVDKDIVIHRVKGGKILNKLLPKKSLSVNNQGVKKGSRRLLIAIKNKLVMIDPYTSWVNHAYNYFKDHLMDVKFDIILGMHEPPSSLICSYKIKNYIKKYNKNIKLISYFSDPYCNEVSRRNKDKITRLVNGKIEKRIINCSDKLLFVTENNMKYYIEKYGLKGNVGLIHRGFDKDVYRSYDKLYPKEFKKNTINMLYAGDIVKDVRDIREFVYALDLFKEQNPKFSDLNINFFGNIHDSLQYEEVSSREFINLRNRIPYKDVLSFIVNADILIIFGNKEFSQIPAKVYDYMGSRGYIFVILESYEDPLYNLVKDIDGVYCSLNEKNMIFRTLSKIISDFSPDREFNRSIFSSNVILNKILEFLDVE